MTIQRIRYVGLDVHKRVVEVCILDHAGNVVHRERFALNGRTLELVATHVLRPTDRVALEATTNCWAVADVLRPHVAKVVVSNPMATKAIAMAKVKTDKVDAYVLAMRLVETPLRLFEGQGRDWLAAVELDPQARALVDSDLRQLAFLQKEIDTLDAELAKRGQASMGVKTLMTLPGVDVATAQAMLAAWGDPQRFSESDRAASYLGLVPSTKQSADQCYHGPITKRGNTLARWMLIEAAQHLDKHPGPLGHFFRRLLKKKNRNVAVVAGARKLAAIGWQMLVTGEPYRYAIPRSTEAKLSRLRVKATGQRRQPDARNAGRRRSDA